MRRAAKVDTNHSLIVDAFRAHGCLVQSLAALGKGCPDLLVACPPSLRGNRLLFLVEVKRSTKSKLTPDQVAWHAEWAGAPVYVVVSVDDVARVVGGG